MKNQKGHIDIDIPSIMTGCLIVGSVIGTVVTLMVPYLWDYLKPMLQVLVS